MKSNDSLWSDRPHITRRRLLASAFATLSLPGCRSSNRGSVSGCVTYNGKPVTNGYVAFHAEGESKPYLGRLGAEGKYRIDVVPTGRLGVTIVPPPPKRNRPGVAPISVEQIQLPRKYRDTKTSELSAEIHAGSNEYNLDLK